MAPSPLLFKAAGAAQVWSQRPQPHEAPNGGCDDGAHRDGSPRSNRSAPRGGGICVGRGASSPPCGALSERGASAGVQAAGRLQCHEGARSAPRTLLPRSFIALAYGRCRPMTRPSWGRPLPKCRRCDAPRRVHASQLAGTRAPQRFWRGGWVPVPVYPAGATHPLDAPIDLCEGPAGATLPLDW